FFMWFTTHQHNFPQRKIKLTRGLLDDNCHVFSCFFHRKLYNFFMIHCYFSTVRLMHAVNIFKKGRSEEHTSELQSRFDLVCRLLLEKKKQKNRNAYCI